MTETKADNTIIADDAKLSREGVVYDAIMGSIPKIDALLFMAEAKIVWDPRKADEFQSAVKSLAINIRKTLAGALEPAGDLLDDCLDREQIESHGQAAGLVPAATADEADVDRLYATINGAVCVLAALALLGDQGSHIEPDAVSEVAGMLVPVRDDLRKMQLGRAE
ncbi:MAG TPA: hypothetical protein PK231_04765 [Acidocella sp.]|nr:hypothetical protein [Acidocella sp.]